MEHPLEPSPMPAKAVQLRKKGGYKQRKGGRVGWLKRLVKAGQLAKAAAYAKRHNLPTPPACVATASGDLAATSGFASHGGAGVALAAGRENWDKSTPTVENSQCSPLATADAVPLAIEAEVTRLAAKAGDTPTVTPPTGESEGERGFGQAQTISCVNQQVDTEEVVSVWPGEGEGIVGKVCRNKQYNELRVMGEGGREMWTKVGNWKYRMGLIRGERVFVRRVWVSGDDTDAEYDVVRRLDVNEPATEEPVVPVVVAEEVVQPIEDVAVEAPSAVPEQQTPVAILPQFQREEPDFPRTPESGQDYIARIRAEAALWANGQGR